MEWIKVTERLPEMYTRVLAVRRNEEDQVEVRTVVRYNTPTWLWEDCRWAANPTHWMPLPEPPVEE